MMLLEASIGDAYGRVFEYADDTFVTAFNTAENYIKRKNEETPVGRYTDDAQMSLAIAEALIIGDWSPSVLVEHFFQAFKRDERTGYAKRFYRLLKEVKTSGELLERLTNQTGPGSDKSGASMRACPIGVLPSIGDVLQKSRIQAVITHNSTDGQNAAMAASLLTHYCLYNLGPKADVGCFIQDYVNGPWSAPWVGPVGEKGWQSVRAAITVVSESKTMREVLKRSIAFTGDVDTVATIACATAAHCREIENDLPKTFYDNLENGTYGRDYIADIDRKLMSLVNN